MQPDFRHPHATPTTPIARYSWSPNEPSAAAQVRQLRHSSAEYVPLVVRETHALAAPDLRTTSASVLSTQLNARLSVQQHEPQTGTIGLPSLSRSADDIRPPPRTEFPSTMLSPLLPRRGAARESPRAVERIQRDFTMALKALVHSKHLVGILDTMALMGPIMDVDLMIGTMSDAHLWRLALVLSRKTPHQLPGYTRYHQIVMCVADHMTSRHMRYH